MTTTAHTRTAELLAIEDAWGAHNYHPLPIVVAHAKGAWVTDVEGRRYLDCLSAYSALNQGHVHPAILSVFIEQASRVTLTSRAFRNDQLPLFCQELASICKLDVVLPMNTGAEAVETAIKAARRWGYEKKGIPADAAEVVVCAGNFHGRTTTLVGFSSEEDYKRNFGPFTPGFVTVTYGDIDALAAAITPHTCAFLIEPIQCEAGIIMPPTGFMRAAADLCRTHNVLLIADEIQTGLGRTGKWFACDHEDVQPDLYVLGKALAGGFYPVSACVGRREVMELFTPGSHGSTFGGNPLGAAVARAALQVLRDEELIARSARLGRVLLDALGTIQSPVVKEVRGLGLLAGVELHVPARKYCERLLERGVLCKETHERVIRLAPPLVIDEADLLWMVDQLRDVLVQA
ncbi:MAG: ornithine--oxo-acid transaminase [Acidobacteria bacterium]|nr:ornithine--oxo-acid transaminase [Acidobacteriota bacterium]